MIQILRSPEWIKEDQIENLLKDAFSIHEEKGLLFAAVTVPKVVAQNVLNEETVYVAVDEKRLIGLIAGKLQETNDGEKRVYVSMLAVATEYRGKQLSKQLFGILSKEYPEAEWIYLDTASDAKGLVNYYEKLGFEITKYFWWENTNYVSVQMRKKNNMEKQASGYKKGIKPVAFFVTNTPQIYSVLPLFEALDQQGIEYDVIIPDQHDESSDWEKIWGGWIPPSP